LLLALIALSPGPARAEARLFIMDAAHTSIGFLVTHIGFAKTLGMFKNAQGSFVFDESAPAVREISASIDAASVFTNHTARDEHLRSAEFLDVQNHPTITFKGTSATPTGPRTGTVSGDLTIRGVTRPVTLEVTWNRSGEYPIADKHYAVGISARTTIKRSNFGMTYALADNLVGDDVEIIIELEAARQPAS
jgi:polyisoprenoid-binding protein YceI